MVEENLRVNQNLIQPSVHSQVVVRKSFNFAQNIHHFLFPLLSGSNFVLSLVKL